MNGGNKSDRWLTPREILDPLGVFDLDPCQSSNPRWATARHHYTAADDGLVLPWFGRIWLNPPYSAGLCARFMQRMADHRGRGIALVNNKAEAGWFQDFVEPVATALLFPRGRVRFIAEDPYEQTGHVGWYGQVLIAYGFADAEVLADCGIRGTFRPLALPRFVAVAVLAAQPTWRALLTEALGTRGPVRLEELYRSLARHAKTARNPHWRDKVRQVLQQGPFRRVARGVWELLPDAAP